MRIKILCPDGQHYVRTAQDGTLDAVATVADQWEIFELHECPDGRFSLKTLDVHPCPSKYVRAAGGGSGALIADRDLANDHERFTKLALPGGRVAIKTFNETFWRALNSGGAALDCGAAVPDAWEAFTIQIV